MPTSAFPERGKCPFFTPVDAHAIIDYFILGSTNKASSSNETKKGFLTNCEHRLIFSIFTD